MKFAPKTEKEVAEEGLLPRGEYGFEVVSAENKISRANNEMIELKLNIFDEHGDARSIFDYLLESMARKLRHAAEACGLLTEYESGDLDALDFVGKSGTLKIGIQKDKTGQYPDKNVVTDYVRKAPVAHAAPSKIPTGLLGEGKPLDDEIPF